MSNYMDKKQLIDTINALTLDGEFSEADAKYLVQYILAQGDMEGSPRDMMQVYRGYKKDLPNLVQGELGYTLDTNEIYVGGLEGNKNLLEVVYKNGVMVDNFPRLEDETSDSGRIQRAIAEANAKGVRQVIFSSPLYEIEKIILKSNIEFISHNGSVIRLLNTNEATEGAAITSRFPTVNLENITFRGLTFEGNKDLITQRYYHIIGIYVEDGYRLDNLLVEDCTFYNAKEDFIRVTGRSGKAKANNIVVNRCNFYGGKDEYTAYSGNGLRVTISNYAETNYGDIFATGITVSNCYAEYIRTLSDIKRGSSDFVICNNTTYNIYDIDYSCDGVFSGRVYGNKSSQSDDFLPIDSHNVIEIQAENLLVYGNDLGAKRINGILVSDYGHPDEGGVGHVSKNIKIFNNIIRNAKLGVGIKSVNAHNIEVTGNQIIQSVVPIVIDEGSSYKDTQGNPLKAGSSLVANNQCGTAQYGIVMKGSTPFFGSGNVDANGSVPIQYSQSPNMIVTSEMSNLNFNPNLDIDVDTNRIKYWETGEDVVEAATKPMGALKAVTVQDNNTSALATVGVTGFDIPAKQNEVIHVGLFVKKNTALGAGIVFNEYNGATFLKSGFVDLTPTTEWVRRRVSYRMTDPAATRVVVAINPATSINYPQATGSTDIANLKISKYAVN